MRPRVVDTAAGDRRVGRAVHADGSRPLTGQRAQPSPVDLSSPQRSAEELAAAAGDAPWPEQVGDFWQTPHPGLVAIAEHPNTPPEMLSRLSRANSRELRVVVAAHPALPVEGSHQTVPQLRSRYPFSGRRQPEHLPKSARQAGPGTRLRRRLRRSRQPELP